MIPETMFLSVSGSPTFPGKMIYGRPEYRLSGPSFHTGMPAAACPKTHARFAPSAFVAISLLVMPPFAIIKEGRTEMRRTVSVTAFAIRTESASFSSGDIPKNGTVFLNLIFSLTILTKRLLYSIKQVYYME